MRKRSIDRKNKFLIYDFLVHKFCVFLVVQDWISILFENMFIIIYYFEFMLRGCNLDYKIKRRGFIFYVARSKFQFTISTK